MPQLIKVRPTKIELIKLRRRLTLAQRIQKIIKDRLSILTMEFLQVARATVENKKKLLNEFAQYYRSISITVGYHSYIALEKEKNLNTYQLLSKLKIDLSKKGYLEEYLNILVDDGIIKNDNNSWTLIKLKGIDEEIADLLKKRGKLNTLQILSKLKHYVWCLLPHSHKWIHPTEKGEEEHGPNHTKRVCTLCNKTQYLWSNYLLNLYQWENVPEVNIENIIKKWN